MKRRKKSFANLPDTFKDMQLNTFSISVYKLQESKNTMRAIVESIKVYMSEFKALQAQGKGLYLYSETKGSGKTRLVASVANELIKEHQVKFATSTAIIEEIKKSWDKDTEVVESKLIDDLIMAEILIIDDFGTEEVKPWINQRFYHIVNERYNYKRVTIYTSNYDLKKLQYDDRTTNRIKETTFQIRFPEESIRDYIADDNKKMLAEYMRKEG